MKSAANVLIALWRVGFAILFYPLMIGLIIWLYTANAHWGVILALILAIFIIDPIWRVLGGEFYRKTKAFFSR